MRGKVFIEKPNYKKIVPSRVRRKVLFKKSIPIRKKLVSLLGRFDNVCYEDEFDADVVYWEWEYNDYVFTFLVYIGIDHNADVRYSLKIESSTSGYIPLSFCGVFDIDTTDIVSFARHWNDGIKEGRYDTE